MKFFLIFSFCLTYPFFAFSQNDQQYLNLNYAEIDSLVMISYKKGDFPQCLLLTQIGRDKAKAEFGAQDSVFAEFTDNLGFFCKKTGQFDKALPLYIQAKEIREKNLGTEHLDVARSLNNLATLYLNMGHPDKALPLLIQSKNIKEKVLGTAHPSFAKSLNNLASLYNNIGNYDKALPLLIQSKNIREKALGTEHPVFAKSLNNLAGLYQDMGHPEKALPLYIQAKEIKEKALGTEHPDFATALSNLAYLHQGMGNYDKTLPLLIQAKNIREKVLGTKHPRFAISLNNLAALHQRMGSYNKALHFFTKAKEIKEETFGTEHPDFAASLNNLASLYQDMGRPEKALPLYNQGNKIYEKTLGSEHPDFARALNNLAFLHQDMGNYDKALPLYIQANKIYEKTLGSEHPTFVLSLTNLALLYKDIGNYELAWDLLYQGMNSLSSLNLKHTIDNNWLNSLKTASYPSSEHIKRMVTALNAAYLLLDVDNSITNTRTKQTILADLATALLSKMRNQVSNDKDKLDLLSLSHSWLLRSLEVLPPETDTKKAFNRSDQNKSVLLLQATQSEAVYRLGELPDSLIWKDKELLKTQSQLQAKLIERRSKEVKDSLRNKLNRVNQEIDAFIKIVKKEYPKYHKLKYQPAHTKVEEVQALLDENTALLEYVIGDSVVHIFYVDKKQVQWFKSFVPNKILNNKIKLFHQNLSNYTAVVNDKKEAYRNYTIQAHWFYQNLMAQALIDKPNLKNLIIVADGALGHLPFEAFLVEQATQKMSNYNQLHYLVNDYNISYNYSATLWKETVEAPTPKNNGQIFALAANYKLQLDSSIIKLRLPTDYWLRSSLSQLPGARREIESLQEHYQGFFAFDTLASEKTVKERAGDFAILHFATHGILDAKRPMLSSLAFSEDNDRIESNFWQAHEISKIQLNANLVVLSACETGFGKFEKGNGIASLARAFTYAGASSLIVSLWQVNDYATSEIMKILYQNLAKGMKIDEALRQSKLQYMSTAEDFMAHPAFWSPFIQMGNTQAVHIKKKGGSMPWGIGLGILVLLGIGGFLMTRKNKESA